MRITSPVCLYPSQKGNSPNREKNNADHIKISILNAHFGVSSNQGEKQRAVFLLLAVCLESVIESDWFLSVLVISDLASIPNT